ncbi:sigma-70 family RNA polymerase sigma factor [Dyadobacter sp. LHD-138]|uniref:RNA polymerase sigma factor n=1 Tax=Dyadobacter sp. LHD-138 TaxID=3071413 RepID=UPI0027E0C2A5|nr:sigma-70 family RNA polymerase sigma factor [Dyadobacter sp. LHD-138]MDQ6481775.1 sigma-70 family RNA polymerase sigma factor [Dyadobacter sp. LHD-138]
MDDSKVSQESEEFLLWQRFKIGDKEAFSRIYTKYAGILYNYGYHMLPDTYLVQDAIQDLFTDLWRMRQNLAHTTSIKYYLFRSLRRKIHRLSAGERLFDSFQEDDQDVGIPFVLSDEALRIERETTDEQILALQKALLKLPSRQLEAIRLRFFDGFELDQVADIMQMNEQSARNLIQRSLRKLRLSFDLLVMIYLFRYFF